MEIVESASVSDLYGRWNGLLALDEQGSTIGIVCAHDGDFFPESVMDYVAAIRTQSSTQQADASAVYPVRADIDITQACNSRCTFCFSRPYQQDGYRGQFASAELLERVIADLGRGGTKSIRFCGGGDPLVHPEIRSVLPFTHAAGMRLCVISNLDFLDGTLSDLILRHVDHLRWSVNAASDETRLKVHRPGKKANPLHVSMQRVEELIRQRPGRSPVIWATFLVLPTNFLEIPEAARQLRDVGVDSVSFRPVYHGLDGSWTKEALAALPDLFEAATQFDDRPRFSVFVPKRDLQESADLDPSAFFSHCRSRHLRTVLEATSAGLTIQSCGTYRGTGSANRKNITSTNSFETAWGGMPGSGFYPSEAPAMCERCIDVSMNVTLGALATIIQNDRSAKFYRIRLDTKELADLHAGSLLPGDRQLPAWTRMPTAITRTS